MGAKVLHRLRQVPHYAARQPRRGRSAASGVFPQRRVDARIGESETFASAVMVGASDCRRAAATLRAVRAQPPTAESLFAQGESGSAVGLSLPGGDGAVLPGLDGSAAVATIDPVSEAGRDVTGSL